jgi:hypothetical protein
MLICAREATKIGAFAGTGAGHEEGYIGLLRLRRSNAEQCQTRGYWRAYPYDDHLITSRHWRGPMPAIARAQHQPYPAIPTITRA